MESRGTEAPAAFAREEAVLLRETASFFAQMQIATKLCDAAKQFAGTNMHLDLVVVRFKSPNIVDNKQWRCLFRNCSHDLGSAKMATILAA